MHSAEKASVSLVFSRTYSMITKHVPRSTAVHEAGQAIANCRYGFGFHAIHVARDPTIFIDQRDRRLLALGLCEGSLNFDDSHKYGSEVTHYSQVTTIDRSVTRARAFRFLIMCNAGIEAKARQTGKPSVFIAVLGKGSFGLPVLNAVGRARASYRLSFENLGPSESSQERTMGKPDPDSLEVMIRTGMLSLSAVWLAFVLLNEGASSGRAEVQAYGEVMTCGQYKIYLRHVVAFDQTIDALHNSESISWNWVKNQFADEVARVPFYWARREMLEDLVRGRVSNRVNFETIEKLASINDSPTHLHGFATEVARTFKIRMNSSINCRKDSDINDLFAQMRMGSSWQDALDGKRH